MNWNGYAAVAVAKTSLMAEAREAEEEGKEESEDWAVCTLPLKCPALDSRRQVA